MQDCKVNDTCAVIPRERRPVYVPVRDLVFTYRPEADGTWKVMVGRVLDNVHQDKLAIEVYGEWSRAFWEHGPVGPVTIGYIIDYAERLNAGKAGHVC